MNDTPTPPPGQVATQHAQAFIATHGRVAVTVLVGGVAATLGALLPFAYTNGLFGGGQSYTLVQSGFYGTLMLILPIVLGLFPITMKQHARFTRAAFSVASALFGIIFAMWLASSGTAGMLGGGFGGLAIGFYLTLLGYGAMIVGYYLLEGERLQSNA